MDASPLSAVALDEPTIKSTVAPQIAMANPMNMKNADGKNVVVVTELSGHVAGMIVHIAHVQDVAFIFSPAKKQIVDECVLAVVAVRGGPYADLTKHFPLQRLL